MGLFSRFKKTDKHSDSTETGTGDDGADGGAEEIPASEQPEHGGDLEAPGKPPHDGSGEDPVHGHEHLSTDGLQPPGAGVPDSALGGAPAPGDGSTAQEPDKKDSSDGADASDTDGTSPTIVSADAADAAPGEPHKSAGGFKHEEDPAAAMAGAAARGMAGVDRDVPHGGSIRGEAGLDSPSVAVPVGDRAGSDGASPALQDGELGDIGRRIRDVKDEYGASVKKLMDVKKDLNQKRADLESAQSSLERVRADIARARKLGAEASDGLATKKKDLAKIQGEISDAQESYDELMENIAKEQHALSIIKIQQSETEQSLEEANARLYNAREDLSNLEQFPDTSSLSHGERKFIENAAQPSSAQPSSAQPESGHAAAASDGQPKASGPSSASVIEAASVVVASLKSKLGTVQKELDTTRLMLVQEREQHEATRMRLAALTNVDDTGPDEAPSPEHAQS